MRVAFLSDIHANLPAFEAALAHARRWGADEVQLLGDLVGNGPHPKEVVALARKRRLASVAGNHDLAVSGAEPIPPALKAQDPEAASAFQAQADWTARQMDKNGLLWLRSLTRTRRLRLGRMHALLAHASPESAWSGIGHGLPDDVLAARVAGARCDVLVVGHTHRAEVRSLPGGRFFLNAGSVGRSLDGPEATLLLADFGVGDFSVARVAFDVESWARDWTRAREEANPSLKEKY